MAILFFADHDNVALSEHTARALTAATKIGGEFDILIAGKNAGAAADAAAKLAGVRTSSRSTMTVRRRSFRLPITAW